MPPIILWFREDLRLSDNAALSAAVESGQPIIAFYCLDTTPELRPLGGASLWWLSRSLKALMTSVSAMGGNMVLRKGASSAEIMKLVHETGATSVFWNRRYDPAGIALDTEIKASLTRDGIQAKSFAGHLLREPWTITTKTGTPPKVFTPFWKAHQTQSWRDPLPAPSGITGYAQEVASNSIDAWQLEPSAPDWAKAFGDHWQPGEAGAKAKLAAFLDDALQGYSTNRNRPDMQSTSRLSPHLRFGEITPAQIARATRIACDAHPARERDGEKFLSEIGWREFSYALLHQRPDLPRANFQSRFDDFPWHDDPQGFQRWTKGRTGFPIVDAGMRELWQTGYMHNRVRMIVGSFLVKNLLVDWRRGEEWFWDTLLDADHANNAASWQWIAGSGADAAPYFRIFNPVLQGETQDPDGHYVRTYVPELAQMPREFIHKPWEAPPLVLHAAGVTLGANYPRPIMDHSQARDRAMEAFRQLPAKE